MLLAGVIGEAGVLLIGCVYARSTPHLSVHENYQYAAFGGIFLYCPHERGNIDRARVIKASKSAGKSEK